MKKQAGYRGSPILLSAAFLLLVALPLLAFSQKSSRHSPAAAQKTSSESANAAQQQSQGEKKFNQNCSRCHTAPEGFPPRISGTILRHMRVRASLSEQDERDILRFLNP
jgi:mono/diheme cytochrome c family protein